MKSIIENKLLKNVEVIDMTFEGNDLLLGLRLKSNDRCRRNYFTISFLFQPADGMKKMR